VRKSFTDEDLATAETYIKSGMTYKKISEITGVSEFTLGRRYPRLRGNCPNCGKKLFANNKTGWCQACAVSRVVKMEYMLTEAEKRGRCFYENIPLPDGLACPGEFRRDQWKLAWEWDHVDPLVKTNTISYLVQARMHIRYLIIELSKVELTCHYHHRLR
jgi:hypothetical protein